MDPRGKPGGDACGVCNAGSKQPEYGLAQMASNQNQTSIRAVFGALFLALWLAALDQTVVSTALPTMVRPSLAHAVIPAPSQCLGRYHGKLIVRYVTNIHAACPGNLYANACNYRFPNL